MDVGDLVFAARRQRPADHQRPVLAAAIAVGAAARQAGKPGRPRFARVGGALDADLGPASQPAAFATDVFARRHDERLEAALDVAEEDADRAQLGVLYRGRRLG